MGHERFRLPLTDEMTINIHNYKIVIYNFVPSPPIERELRLILEIGSVKNDS